jgi:Two component regulator propeller
VRKTHQRARPFVPVGDCDRSAQSIRVTASQLCRLSYDYLRREANNHRRSMRRVGSWVAVLIVTAAVSLLLPSRSYALTPDRDIAQYAHHSWKIDDGYFGSNPYSLAQDNDGYLWIGTYHGLYRYDGDRFLRWNPPDGTHLPSTTIVFGLELGLV